MRMGAGARVHPVAVVRAAAQVLWMGGARLGPIQRGGRGMTRSRVISWPQHGHWGLAGSSGGGRGLGAEDLVQAGELLLRRRTQEPIVPYAHESFGQHVHR